MSKGIRVDHANGGGSRGAPAHCEGQRAVGVRRGALRDPRANPRGAGRIGAAPPGRGCGMSTATEVRATVNVRVVEVIGVDDEVVHPKAARWAVEPIREALAAADPKQRPHLSPTRR